MTLGGSLRQVQDCLKAVHELPLQRVGQVADGLPDAVLLLTIPEDPDALPAWLERHLVHAVRGPGVATVPRPLA